MSNLEEPIDTGRPPYYGYMQVEEAPYPMTAEEFFTWPREPGWKYELHGGMCTRLWRGPSAFYGGYAILFAYQPAAQVYTISIPELPGCQMEHQMTGKPDSQEWEQAIQQGAEAIDRWVQAAQAAGASIPLPRALEEVTEPPLDHLRGIGIIPIQTKEDYILAAAAMNGLVKRLSNNATHPLAEVRDVLAEQLKQTQWGGHQTEKLAKDGESPN